MTPPLRRALVALIATMLVLSAAPALAADPAAWKTVDVALHSEASGAVLLVSGELPDSAELPAQVELAAPAGSRYLWAGEILGGPVSEDPEVTYTVSQRNGMDVYAFTLTKSRVAQLEVDGAQALRFDGTDYSAQLDWTAPWPVASLSLSARIPQGARIVSPAEGASVEAAPPGFSYYRKDFTDVAAGEPAALAFAYSAPVAGAAGSTAAGAAANSGGMATAVALIVVLGALALVGFAVWRKMERRRLGDEVIPVAAVGSSAGNQSRGTRGAASTQRAAAEPAATRGFKKSTVLAVAVALALVVGVIIAATSGGSANVVGDSVIMTYAQVDECAVANIALTPPPGASLADDAEKILEALRPLEGVGKAVISLSASTIVVDYCQSYADETRIRELLAPTGYVTAAAAAPAPAPAAEATAAP